MASGAALIGVAPNRTFGNAAQTAPAATRTLATVSGLASDEVLFGRAAQGENEALGELVGRYEQPLYGLLLKLTGGDAHRAEDAFQDTFLHAMRAAKTFDRKMHFKPWVTAIAVNLIRDDARKRKVRGEVTLDRTADHDAEFQRVPEPVSKHEGPTEAAERKDEQARVRGALTGLTHFEREVVLLHFFQDMTLAEAAQVLKIPLGTVKSRLHAGLMRLGKLLERGKE